MGTAELLIIGGGVAGIAVAASVLRRRPEVSIAIVEPRNKHYYQPAWTLVAGGLVDPARTERPMLRCIPKGVLWVKTNCAEFDPVRNAVVLESGERISYRALVVCPGIKLKWDAIEGLPETLGQNGVTSNYKLGLASYTWQLVRSLKEGIALFTQPSMPIKCPAAPQKAVYLSSDLWRRWGALRGIDVKLNVSGPVLFSVPPFIPVLMGYVDRYRVALSLKTSLKAIDGPGRTAWFERREEDGSTTAMVERFDMIHVVPPQSAPDFVFRSPLANDDGWVDVEPMWSPTPFGTAATITSSASAMSAQRPAPRPLQL